MKIGTKIASIRKNSKFTQEFLAAKLDRTPQWISNIERGIRSVDTNALARLADLLNVGSGDFFETKLNDTCIWQLIPLCPRNNIMIMQINQLITKL